MTTRTAALAAALGALAVACGGSESSQVGVCAPDGTWAVTLGSRQSSSATCQVLAPHLPTVDRLTVTVSGTSITVQDNTGETFTGAFDQAACKGAFSAQQTSLIRDFQGQLVNATAKASLEATFSGSSVTGHQAVSVEADVSEPGIPCTITSDFTGRKQ